MAMVLEMWFLRLNNKNAIATMKEFYDKLKEKHYSGL